MDLDPRVCERARIARDARFDGRFFIAVVTTGIYCRPVCPVRAPRSKNVRYYSTAAAASEAGFRPCLRCRPEAAPGTPAWLGTSSTVSRALRLIADGALDRGGVADLARPLGVTSRHLSRLFVKHLGASPLAVAQTRRLHFAKNLIDQTSLPMTEVALSAGYGSVRRFNHAFRKTYGKPPGELRRKRNQADTGEGERAVTLRLFYRPPFDWKGLIDFLTLRAIPGVEQIEPRCYRRTIDLDGRRGIVEVRPDNAERCLVLRVDFPDPRALFRIAERTRRLFDLDADAAEISRHLRRDPLLGPLVRKCPGRRVPGAWDGFELAVRAVLGQQVSVKGASTLAGRLVRRHGSPLDTEDAGLTHVFPRPEDLADADLSDVGLTGARAEALRRLARAVARGELSFEPGTSPELLAERLAAIRGIGPWTAEYIKMRALGDPDAFPASDLWLLRAVLGEGVRASAAPRLIRRAEAWRPWRAYAAMHLWNQPRTD